MLIDTNSKTFPTKYKRNDTDYAKGWNACIDSVMQQERVIIVDKTLEAVEKYKWHDLRKDPEDLPEKSGFYLVAYRSLPGIIMNPNYIVFYFYRSNEGKYTEWQAPNYITVIAWKEIKPLEGEDDNNL